MPEGVLSLQGVGIEGDDAEPRNAAKIPQIGSQYSVAVRQSCSGNLKVKSRKHIAGRRCSATDFARELGRGRIEWQYLKGGGDQL